MTQAALLVILVIVLLVATTVCWAWLLSIGLNWAKAENVTIGKLALATLTTLGVGLIATIQFSPPPEADSARALLYLAGEFAIKILLPLGVIALTFRLTLRQAIKAWCVTLFASVSGLVLVAVILKPWVAEAYRTSANSMAPTLVGEHLQGVCPACGQTAYCSPAEQVGYDRVEMPRYMICGICLQVHEPAQLDEQVHPADRFAVAKYLEPRRWDLIAFRFPIDPSKIYVKRLVGLPGEAVVIKEGGVWINGTRLEPPPAIADIDYLDALPEGDAPPGESMWGTEEHPAKLGTDEYFVLGDFSIQSYDSRLWQTAGDGRPAYAVPEENIVGVVTQIYWPPRRWRALR